MNTKANLLRKSFPSIKPQRRKDTANPSGKRDQTGSKTTEVQASLPAKNLLTVMRRERDSYLARRISGNLLTNYTPPPPVSLVPIRIAPDTLIENRPAWVEFYVWNSHAGPLADVFVRVRVSALQSIDTYPGVFEFDLKNLGEGQTVQGAISFFLPRADLQNKLTLELCQWGEIPRGGEFPPLNILAMGEIMFDVAARFSIRMRGIFIRDTASHHNDTVVVSFGGMLGENRWDDNAHLGDHNNTTGRGGLDPEVLPVGPFDMLPGSGSNVAISCVIANAGHTSTEEEAKKALKVVSQIGAETATTVMSIIFPVGAGVWSLLSTGADQLHQAIIDWALADCDTVVMNDGRLFSESELFLITLDPNDTLQEPPSAPADWIWRTRKKAGEIIAPGWLGGGCRDSDYSAVFSPFRHRVPEMFHNTGVDGLRLSPGQRATFGPIGHDVARRTYEIDGRAGGITPLGEYAAPMTPTDKKFDVVKWTVYRDTKNGIEEAWTDFAIVLLD